MFVILAATILSVLTNAPAMAWAVSGLPKLVLLDRDGVINEDVGSPGVVCKSQFRLTHNAGYAIGLLKRSGCHVAVITNQSCVGKGLLTMVELHDMHTEMEHLLLQQDKNACIDRIYVCTTVKEDPRKKPNPGMIFEVCQDFGVDPSVDCVFIGDTLTDMRAAKAGGVVKRILVQTGYGLGLMGNRPAADPPELIKEHNSCLEEMSSDLLTVTPFFYAANLASAVDSLMKSQIK